MQIENTTINLWKAGGLVVSVAAGAVTIAVVLTDLEHKMDALAIALAGLRAEIETLSLHAAGRAPEGFHRRDMAEWCAASEQANPPFACPDPYSLPGMRRFGKAGN